MIFDSLSPFFSFQSTNSNSLGIVYGTYFFFSNETADKTATDKTYLQSRVFTLITSTLTHSNSLWKKKENNICDSDDFRQSSFAISYLMHEDVQSKKTSSAIVTSVLRYFWRDVTFSRIGLYREDAGKRGEKRRCVSFSAREIRPPSRRDTSFFSGGIDIKISLQLCINRSLRLAYQLYN